MGIQLIKDSGNNLLCDNSGRLLQTRPINEKLLETGLVGEFYADYINNVGGYCQSMYNLALPEIATIAISGTVTSLGTRQMIINTGDINYNIPVTFGESANTVAANIRAAVFANTTNTGSLASAILTKNLVVPSVNTTVNLSNNSITGITATVTVSQGINLVQNNPANCMNISTNFLNGKTGLYAGTGGKNLSATILYTGTVFIVMRRSLFIEKHGIGTDGNNILGNVGNSILGHLVNGSFKGFYKNNKFYATTSNTGTDAILCNYSSVSNWSTLGYFLNGDAYIYSVAMYNRSLSIAEIAYNMQAYSSYYNIPLEA